jgi:hypothetical protein
MHVSLVVGVANDDSSLALAAFAQHKYVKVVIRRALSEHLCWKGAPDIEFISPFLGGGTPMPWALRRQAATPYRRYDLGAGRPDD